VGNGRAAATRCFCGAAATDNYQQVLAAVTGVKPPLSEAMYQKTPSQDAVVNERRAVEAIRW
jgi:hypothetical protein